ncbi:MAG: response regulator [Ruminococcus sp.]|jgi:CheY-like chemotaxis protein|nr:response regulator [Ruminococcus sp.]
MKEEYFSNAIHGIRTPVNTIVGLTVLARRTENIDEIGRFLTKIEEASYQLIATVETLSDMYQMENEKIYLESNEFDIEELLDSVLDMVYVKADAKDVNIFLDLRDVFRVKISADRFKLAKVLYNLLNSAIDFSQQGNKVLIRVHMKSSRELFFSVATDAKGFTEQKVGILFGADSDINSLSLCRGIVKLMGGELAVECAPEKGLKFSFTAAVHAEKRGDSELIRDLSALRSKILVIENKKEVVEFVTRTAAEVGGTVSAAPTLAAAARYLLHGAEFSSVIVGFDMIITDFALIMGNITRYVDPKNIIIFAKNNHHSLAQEMCVKSGYQAVKIITVPILPTALLEQAATGFGLKIAQSFRTAIAPDFSGKNILLVDDHDMTIEITTGILEPTKAKIFTAKTGLEAVTAYTENPDRYDAILMDVQMPVMDGLTATRTIRATEASTALTVPIIAMTANIFDLDKKSCYDAGMSRYVSKPVSVRELYRVLSEVLN